MQIYSLCNRLCGAEMAKVTPGSEKYRRNRAEAIRMLAGEFSLDTPRAIFVCSPYSGETAEEKAENVDLAKKACKYVAREKGFMPVAPHLYFTRFLDDEDEGDRDKGIGYGLCLLDLCDEVWVFGTRISTGMKTEIRHAEDRGIPVRYIDLVTPEGGEAYA